MLVAQKPHRRGSSFFVPMLLLPKKKRTALKHLYYFFRVVDDAVDEADSKAQARENLAFWREEVPRIFHGEPQTGLGKDFAPVVNEFQLPEGYVQDFLKGMESDCAEQVQLEDEAALQRYCYYVAGTVGLLAMRIFGVQGEQADAFAMQLGEALQLTNILRDVEKDKRMGRCYLPQSWSHLPMEEQKHRLRQKAEERFVEVQHLQKNLPMRPIIPALLMRDIYYQRLRFFTHPALKGTEKLHYAWMLLCNMWHYWQAKGKPAT